MTTAGVLVVVGGISVILVGLVVILGALGGAHDALSDSSSGPFTDALADWYNGPFANWLGLGCSGFDYSLSPEDIERLSAAGLDASAAANAAAAAGWCKSTFGSTIDIGIMLAIWESEGAGGTNFGSCDWRQAISSRWGNSTQAAKEIAAAKRLLNHWRTSGVREKNPIARAFIYPNYDGYIGHCSAGEIGGGGFIPTTAEKVCFDGLNKSGDSDVISCDFWSTKVTFHAIAYWLHAIGYRAEQFFAQKVIELFGWNQNFGYRVQLVSRAQEINGIVGDVTVIGIGGSQGVLKLGESLLGDIKLNLIQILTDLGLLPEPPGWLDAPLPSDYPRVITSEYLDERETDDGRNLLHWGVDWKCEVGVEILALADGEVIKPSPDSLMGRIEGFGNRAWIDHDGLYVVYAHMSEVFVEEGQEVRQGDVIGLCGSTGNSTGPHIHVGVSEKHPDDFVLYGEMNPGWMNPNLVLGTCGVAMVE